MQGDNSSTNQQQGGDSCSISRMSMLSIDSIVSGDCISMDSREIYVPAIDIRFIYNYEIISISIKHAYNLSLILG